MIKYYYKYMPLQEEFFENLMLRATPFRSLNDPFEGQFNKLQLKNAIHDMNSFAAQYGYSDDEPDDYELESHMEVMESDFNSVGVLSFSEDFTNPIMWAHYADQYKGIVIELDYNEPLFQDSIKLLGDRKSRFGESHLGTIYEFPEKVMYRKEMPTFSRHGEAHPSSMSEYPWKKFLYTLFFTKSDDWIYEKELRSIVELKDADSVKCESSEHLLKTLSSNKEITYQKLNNNKIQITFPNEYEMHEEMGDESKKNEIMLDINFNFDSNIYLFRINPQAITRIYCGYKCKYNDVKCLINNNDKLNHLQNNIFWMNINSTSYRLEPEHI